MGLLDALRSDEVETAAALQSRRDAQDRQAELEKESQELHRTAATKRRQIAEATFSRDEAAVQETQAQLTELEQKIIANEAANDIAREKIAEADKRLHQINAKVWLKSYRRNTTRRSKYAAALTEAIGLYLQARRKLVEINDLLQTSWPLPGLPPDGGITTDKELDRQIEQEVFRLYDGDPLGLRPPGATNNPFLTPHELKPFTAEVELANAVLLKAIEEGPPAKMTAAQVSEVPASDPDAALLDGKSFSLPEAQALMSQQHEPIVLDHRKSAGGANEHA